MTPIKIAQITILWLLLLLPLSLTGCGTRTAAQSPDPGPKPATRQNAVDFLTDYRQATAIATQEGRPMLVLFTLPNCVGSKTMLDITFADEEIQKFSRHFVCVQVDGSKETDLYKSQHITHFPTLLCLDSLQQEIGRLSGNPSPDQLALHMHAMIRAAAAKNVAAKTGPVIRR